MTGTRPFPHKSLGGDDIGHNRNASIGVRHAVALSVQMSNTPRRKLMLIDSHALMHRAFHALPPDMSTTSGELTNATFGWTSMVIKAIDDLKPTHVIAAFDCAAPTFRHEQFADYKATRPRTPQPLVQQFERVRQVASAFNMPIVDKPGYEADDVLGALAHQADVEGVDTVIVTGDLDTLQLVNDKVSVLTSKRQLSETILDDIPQVFGRFGISPKQLPDLKGLIGDTSDNIPGIRGIGEKTAARLLAEFESLEGIFSNVDQVKGKVGELLRENRDQAFRSRELATIIPAPVELDLDSAALQDFDMPALLALFRDLEFRSLIPRVQALREGERTATITKLPGSEKEQLSFFEGEPSTAVETGPTESALPTEVEIIVSPQRLMEVASELNSEPGVRNCGSGSRRPLSRRGSHWHRPFSE